MHRDLSIRNFVSEIYYGIASNSNDVELVSKLKFDKDKLEDAKKKCVEYNECVAKVVGKSVKKDTLNPPKLFSLSNLQNVLGKKYKMPMDKSLAIVQKLYEEGYVTYPRTNSEYLATKEKDKIKNIINNIKKLGYEITFKDKKTIFDDSKIESHSALTPTYKIPNKSSLSEDEFIVYSTILKRFVAVFCSTDCKIEKSELKVSLGDLEEFSLKGKDDYQVPFYNISGDKDYQTNYKLAQEYFEEVNAPYKQIFIMENMTHGLLESDSDGFSEIVHQIAKTERER